MPTKFDDLKRATHVVRVLYKHGLGSIVKRTGLTWHLHVLDRHRIQDTLPSDIADRLAAAFEELGGAYIKLAQLLSIRPDLVPPEYCTAFSRLLDQVSPVPFTTIKPVIERELGKPIEKAFRHIDKKPLGSASIAQVYKARLRDGRAVVIKVQRPGVADTFEEDIDILRYLAKKIAERYKDDINPLQIIDEFEKYTRKELNFLSEANNITLIKNTQDKTPQVIIPDVHWAYTTPRILTMTYLDGTKVLNIKETSIRRNIARELIDATLVHIFEQGTFHADVHPGNILYLKDGNIGLLDFGIVGQVTKDTIELGIKMYMALLDRDAEEISSVLLEYGEPGRKTDILDFEKDIRVTLNEWESHTRITQLMYQLFLLCGKHHIALPANAVLVGKALVTAEGTARKLDPDFDFIMYGQHKLVEILRKRNTPKRMIQNVLKRSQDFADVLSALPKEGLELIQTFKHGRATLELDDRKFRHLGFDINHSSNRLSYALIAASSILAGSQLHDVPPFVNEYSLPVLAMYFIASTFILLLIHSILKEHHPQFDPHEEVTL